MTTPKPRYCYTTRYGKNRYEYDLLIYMGLPKDRKIICQINVLKDLPKAEKKRLLSVIRSAVLTIEDTAP